MEYVNLSQTDQNQTKEEPITVGIEDLYSLLILIYLLLAGNKVNPLKKKCRVTNHTKTVISPAWFLIFSQIYVLQVNIYP